FFCLQVKDLVLPGPKRNQLAHARPGQIKVRGAFQPDYASFAFRSHNIVTSAVFHVRSPQQLTLLVFTARVFPILYLKGWELHGWKLFARNQNRNLACALARCSRDWMRRRW